MADFRLLTLNLHCWQESDAASCLNTVARAIAEQAIDVVCFQEAGQFRDNPVIGHSNDVALKSDNAVHLIASELWESYGLDYGFAWDWAHYGWDVWEEGIAILSRLPLANVTSRYVSAHRSPDDWLSRKALSADIAIDHTTVNITTCHTGWADEPRDPFDAQWRELMRDGIGATSLLVGDFNIPAASEAYRFAMTSDIRDVYLDCNPDGMHDATFALGADGWGDTPPARIDYVFAATQSRLIARAAQRMFVGTDYPPVSDHCGVLVEFDIK